MAHEGPWESLFGSGVHFVEIKIQKLKKDGRNSSVPGAVNFYQGEVAFGKKPRFHKIFEKGQLETFLVGIRSSRFCGDVFRGSIRVQRNKLRTQLQRERNLVRETLLGLPREVQETLKRLAL